MKNWTLRDVTLLAIRAHKGQTRQHTGEPYIVHPMRVAMMAAEYGLTHDGHAAAILHDVIEDTRYTLGDITSMFGGVVAGMVWGLTNAEARGVAVVGQDNRAKRKEIDRVWLAEMGPEIKMLKACDMMDNLMDWPIKDKFLDLMLDEASQLMNAMSMPGVDGPTGGMQADVVEDFWDTWEYVTDCRTKFTTPPDEARDEGL